MKDDFIIACMLTKKELKDHATVVSPLLPAVKVGIGYFFRTELFCEGYCHR